MPGHGRDSGGAGELFRFDLVAHRRDRFGSGPDKHNTGLGERARERHVLRQKPVPRMNRLGAARAAGFDDPVDPQIAFGRRRRSDPDRFVGHAHVKRLGVGIRIDRDRGDPHPPRGADDAAGDLAAIGDQDFAEHEPWRRRCPSWPGLSRPSTKALLRDRQSLTLWRVE